MCYVFHILMVSKWRETINVCLLLTSIQFCPEFSAPNRLASLFPLLLFCSC